ncbi:S-methyl-5-thioribose-1-phosphate isomerase [Heliobacterium gestii]|uniref:Methylthioribose-1-phosphate isomerase n=1 Tax=Heliomicrobium gestii TaxID=2699 RepID=A0A845LA53_HELGE|nr:S-methyl-5-thioribose-1-phosphate isomerase [Heliomicrobium gestii]MBM7867053.1 methylthioribose-1-phosphate isomerase [Heliomicrobium gestii]MZP43532.1 S-methyl-5-thioribose-1-phosphate isomerase [Heliomicrobium gestii]
MDTMRWQDDHLLLLDQTKLPLVEEYIECWDHIILCDAIKKLKVRGAPAIGAAAAFGVALAALNYTGEDPGEFEAEVKQAIIDLGKTRPTAVNLFWALRRMAAVLADIRTYSVKQQQERLLAEAKAIFDEDRAMNEQMGQYGLELIPESAGILTHCNAGALATAGYGTALGVIRAAHHAGKEISVFADETRPLLQGARLTAWELMQDGISVTLITDSMAAYVMKQKLVDLVIVGADRITANGDVANKIGTYGVALAAKAHGIPFYVAAPASTFDLSLATGQEIPIEERDAEEVRRVGESITAPPGVPVYNPAFDVTPAELVTAFITDRGVFRPPYLESLRAMVETK